MVVYCPAVNPGKSNDTACPYNATTGGYTCTAPYDAVLGTLSGGCFTAEEIARSVNLSNLQQRAIVLAALSAGVAVGMRMNIQAVSMKNWKPAAIALFGQIICNPIIMIILTLVFGLSKESKMISLIIGTSPGGIGSNIATFLVGGSLAISAICTLAGSLIAIGSFPAWNIAATRIANLEGSAFKVSDLVLSIVAVAAPLFIGVAINYCFGLGDVYGINKINDEIGNSKDKPIVAAECLKTGGGEGGDENITTCGKIVKNIPYVLMGIAILSVIVIIGLYYIDPLKGFYIRTLGTSTEWIAATVQNSAGLGTGYVLAYLFGLPVVYHRTIAFEIGSQNTAIAVVASTFVAPLEQGKYTIYIVVYYTMQFFINIGVAILWGFIFPLDEAQANADVADSSATATA